MDARERENSQSCRPSIKRPWEDEVVLSQPPPRWHGNTLPPINAVSYRKPIPQSRENGSIPYNPYAPEVGGESAAKRMRHGGHTYGGDYNMLSRENLDLNGKLLQAQATQSVYGQHRNPPEPPSFSSFSRKPQGERWDNPSREQGAALLLNLNANIPPLCRRCRRSTSERPNFGVDKSCEDCKNDPELAHVAQNAAIGLSQLAATLSSGVLSQQRAAIGIGIHESSHRDENDARSAACPPIAEVGLRHTLTWLVERISHVNELADKFVQNAAARHSPNIDRQYIGQGNVAHDGLMDIMKRRIDPDSDESVKSRDEVAEQILDAKTYTGRGSIIALIGSDDPPSSMSPRGYHRTSHSFEDASRRLSIMNPPPAPNRQYPSPPGRSLPSPTYHNFPSMPSPSTGSFGSCTPSVNRHLPSGLHQSSMNAYLPPIGHTPDALHAHSTALQHEVALQKIALASLQGEHDKLLQAFSRSQIRANTLEKEHSTADSEIITLTEEKLRLQSQVIELERSIKDLSKSRDEFRNAAVQENKQYIVIVQRASRLESLANQERQSWGRMKAEMEQRISHLSLGQSRSDGSTSLLGEASDMSTTDHAIAPVAHLDERVVLKIEPTPETIFSMALQKDITGELKEEIRQLRLRCAEVEDTLRIVRDESRSMEGIVEALGIARRTILERADQALGSGMQDQPRGP